MFKSNLNAPNGFDVFEPKDTVSEHSMDSAYQSQTGRSQRGTTRPDGNQWMPAYDFSAMHNQFPGSNLTSPMLGPGNSTPFPEQSSFHQTNHAEGMEGMEGMEGLDAPWNTDMSAEQELFSPYLNADTTSSGLSMHPYGMGFPSWDTPTAASLAPLATYNSQQDVAPSMFDMQALSQPQPVSMVSTSTLPAAHSSPSFVAAHDPRRASAQSTAISAYATSPPSTADTRLHADADFHQQHTETR